MAEDKVITFDFTEKKQTSIQSLLEVIDSMGAEENYIIQIPIGDADTADGEDAAYE